MTRTELIAALETAEGPSYALDLAIAQTLVPQIMVMRRNNDDTCNVPHTYRAFTASREHALWLCETLLPGAEYELTNLYGLAVFRAPLNGGENQPWCEGRREDGCMAIAILLGTLRALEAQEPDHG